MNPCRKLRSRLLAVAAMLTLGAVMQAAAPVRPAAEPAGVPLEPRTVYLTFDDGPSRNTEAILSVLREEEVPATFFVTLAEREDYPDAYAALCENGSRVALHCSVHDYDRLYESARSYREDLRELEAGLRELGIPYETLVRLPGGSLNAQADPQVLREILTGLSRDGYTVRREKKQTAIAFDGCELVLPAPRDRLPRGETAGAFAPRAGYLVVRPELEHQAQKPHARRAPRDVRDVHLRGDHAALL